MNFLCASFFKYYKVCKYLFCFLFFQKLDAFRDGLLVENESKKDASAVSSHLFHDGRHKRSSSRWNDEFSPTSSTVTESTQAGELISKTKLAPVNSFPLTNIVTSNLNFVSLVSIFLK
jgi:hypothetical protein